MKTCETCAWFAPLDDLKMGSAGQCHRYPPTPDNEGNMLNVFVGGNDFCGEHTAKEEVREVE